MQGVGVIGSTFRIAAGLGVLCIVFGVVTPAPAVVKASSSFSFNWNGTPSGPTPWRPSTGFDLAIHDRDLTQTFDQPYSYLAQHGADCGPFLGYGVGGTHMVTQYADEVFICNNHMMTSLNGQGYGEITFTPAEMLDWSQGTASVVWQVSTLRTSCRDWLSYNLMPIQDNLLLTDGIGVDLAGEPRNELLFTTGANCASAYTGTDIRNFNGNQIGGPGGAVEDVVPTDTALAAKSRQTFELDVSSTHVRFGMPAFNKWFVDGNLASPLPYSQAIFQFEEHSYTPDKQCNPTPTFCAPGTWHWSSLSMSNVVPFTILRGDVFQVTHAPNNVVHFPAPAPANSYLRMEAIAAPGSLRVSPDGGHSWIPINHDQPSDRNPNGDFTDANFNNIFVPIPAGTQSLTFDATDAYWTWWFARNMSIWSGVPGPGPTQQNPPPTQNPTPSATGKPTATPGTSTPPASKPTPGGTGGTGSAGGSGESGGGSSGEGSSGSGDEGSGGTPTESEAIVLAAFHTAQRTVSSIGLLPLTMVVLLVVFGVTAARRLMPPPNDTDEPWRDA